MGESLQGRQLFQGNDAMYEIKKNLPRKLRGILSLDDFEPAARKHLPRPIFGYVAEAVEDGASLADNRAAFAELGFVPRVMTSVVKRTTQATLFGHAYSVPFGIAPMGICALTAYRGDLVLAAAAQKANIPMVMSGTSLIPLEELARQSPDAWFQAYLPGEDERIVALVDRVARAGFKVLVLTVDTRISSNRENMIRAGFTSPLRPSLRLAWDGLMRPDWLVNTFLRTLLAHGMPHFENSYATRGAPIIARNVERDFGNRDHLNWDHLRLMRERWKGKLVVKGVMAVEDVLTAKECGADGVILSNHGGRQLDGAVSPLRVLPGVVAAVGDWPVMMDGGIRRGTDVLKAIALGARFVFVGRPFNYAASIGGEAGVAHAIDILATELNRDMGLLDLNSLSETGPRLLMRLSGVPRQRGMPL
jgi:L-lactate dehydrogenase (cytochrome)